MNGTARIIGVGLAASVPGWWGTLPAHGVGDSSHVPPRMVGGGWVAVEDAEDRGAGNDRARLGVQLPCPGDDVDPGPRPDPPGRLQVTWAQQSFHLEAVTAASCSNNLHEGSGTGRCGDAQGVIIDWRLVDGGRAGLGGPDTRPDTVQLEILGPGGGCELSLEGPLVGGNFSMQVPPERE